MIICLKIKLSFTNVVEGQSLIKLTTSFKSQDTKIEQGNLIRKFQLVIQNDLSIVIYIPPFRTVS